MPDAAGTYELRYVMGSAEADKAVIARRPIVVRSVAPAVPRREESRQEPKEQVCHRSRTNGAGLLPGAESERGKTPGRIRKYLNFGSVDRATTH